MQIDLNADLGEGAGFDHELMSLITSANVCCGFHAGGPAEIAATLELAKLHGVMVGAHPGYADREHFGRMELDIPSQDITALVLYQLGAIDAVAKAIGLYVRYVKPHGALYNQACRDRRIADAIIVAATRFQLPVVGLPGSHLEAACRGCSQFVPEGFADRRYRVDGSLVSRNEPDAFIHNPDEAVKQVEWLICEKGIRTICIHGDNPDALAFAKAVREALLSRGDTLNAFTG
jgi:UPF0271 protein